MPEHHHIHRVGWLRAAVLGANDGIVSTGSLIVGVAAANARHDDIVIAGVAGLVAGAMSMAAGEYVSVSSQADTERADLGRERAALDSHWDAEVEELAQIYVRRGLESELARNVASQLMEHDALGAHARDELGITETAAARPIQAALSSALTFAGGAAIPLAAVWLMSPEITIPVVASASLLGLAALGATAARLGGAPLVAGIVRVMFWGALAMTITAGVGALFGAVV